MRRHRFVLNLVFFGMLRYGQGCDIKFDVDINESNGRYSFTVSEGAEPSTRLGVFEAECRATDGLSTPVSFSLAGQDKGHFELSDNELLTNENPVISRAVGNTYAIIIQARAENALAEREVVIIVVAASIVDCTQSSDVSVKLERKSPIGRAAFTFDCPMILDSSDFSDLFNFNDADLTLYTSLSLLQAPVVITLTLSSKSNDAKTTLTLEIPCKITFDVDSDDVFGSYRFELYVNSPSGTPIGTVSATYCPLESVVPITWKYYVAGDENVRQTFGFHQNQLMVSGNTPLSDSPAEVYKFHIVAVIEDVTPGIFSSREATVTLKERLPVLLPNIREPLSCDLFREADEGSLCMLLDTGIFITSIVSAENSDYFKLSKNGSDTRVLVQSALDSAPSVISLLLRVEGSDERYEPKTLAVTVNIRDISAPVITDIKRSDGNSIVICWEPPTSGEYNQYQIQLQTLNGDSKSYNIPVQDNECHSFTDLPPGLNYVAKMRAVGTSTGMWSAAFHYKRVKCTYCQSTRPCAFNQCQNGGACSVSDTDVCTTVAEEDKEQCRRESPTSSCGFSDGCADAATENYSCACQKWFSGDRCEVVDFCLERVCTNGRCHSANNNTHTCPCNDNKLECKCEIGYYGDQCSQLNPCLLASPCQHGTCVILVDSSYRCDCSSDFTGQHCEVQVISPDNSCSNDVTVDIKGVFHWPLTRSGSTATIVCGDQDPDNSATRQCLMLNMSPKWRTPDTSKCMEMPENSKSTDAKLTVLNEQDMSNYNSQEIGAVADVLERLAVTSGANPTLSKQYLTVIDNILDSSAEELTEGHVNERMLGIVDTFMSSVTLDTGNSLHLVLNNMELKVEDIDTEETKQGITYRGDSETGAMADASIDLPSEVFSGQGMETFRLKFLTYNDNRLFTDSSRENVTTSKIVGASVNDVNVRNLAECVTYTMHLPEHSTDLQAVCVYWNSAEQAWSTEGVTMLSYSDHNAKCCSNHLTSFAILLDVAPDVPISEKDDRILTTISYIGSGLSIFGLFLTILTYTLFPCLRRDKSGQILINLCSSMLMMNIFYVIGSQRSHVNNIARSCMAIGVLLHYSVISTLGWMSVEAFNLYRMLITVFSTHEKMFIMKRMLYAWGIPLLLVIIALGVDPWNYYDPKSDGCHLSSASPGVYYGTYITPACIILLFNVAVFFMVCRVVLKPRFDHLSGKSSVSTSQIRGVLTVSALLGISWLLGIFAIGKAKVVFQYAFTITNSLQGFCIFVFRCLSHSEAKAAWWQLLVHGTLKRRRGPGYKSTSETSSTLHRQNTKIQRQDSWKRKTTSVKLVSGVNESSYVPKELESRMSKTLESLPKNTSDSETVYCIAKDEKSNLRGSKRGQFWLDKYRLIVGLEKTINNDHTNSYQNKATDA